MDTIISGNENIIRIIREIQIDSFGETSIENLRQMVLNNEETENE